MKKLILMVILLAGSCLCGVADVLSIAGIIAQGEASSREAERIIDGSFLDFMGAEGEEGDYTQYEYRTDTGDQYGYGPSWFSTKKPAWVIVDLGAVFELHTLSIWNFNPGLSASISRSAKTVDVYVRKDAGYTNTDLDGTAFDDSGWTQVASSASLQQNPGGTAQTTSDVVDMLRSRGRYVALNVTQSYGDAGVSLGEIQLFGAFPKTVGISIITPAP